MLRPARILATCSFIVHAILLRTIRADTDLPVTCGSVVKLKHALSGFDLHSHEISYGSGSGQQSVTGYEDTSDANSLWAVQGAKGMDCVQGTPIESGTLVRFQHVNTKRWLHSHKFASPISNQQEVSAFGSDTETDHLDNWEVQSGGGTWMRDGKVKLRHEETKAYLSSSANHRYGRPIAGQLEICAKKKAGKGEEWMATEGLYFPQRTDAE